MQPAMTERTSATPRSRVDQGARDVGDDRTGREGRSAASLLGPWITRVGQYVTAYGLALGLVRFLVHVAKFKLKPAGTISTTLTPGGRRVYLRARTSDLSIFNEIFVNGQYDIAGTSFAAAIQAKYDALLREGQRPLILDIGGNIGLASVFFTQLYPKAEVRLVEMVGSNMAVAAQNTAGLDVQLWQNAVWSRSGRLQIEQSPDFSTARIETAARPAASAADEIEAVTLDQVVGDAGSRLLLVKMDIEGAEAEVFASPNRWLAHAPALFIEPHDEFFGGGKSLPGLLEDSAYRTANVLIRGASLVFVPTAARPEG